ncbi:hypothetical protein ACGF13_35135 [Kitasatospora sp. NPDC048286]|uniref:hypothetical protein n=1 Tax=Kitasatospora sp. NPDC048286 TaxID=3364047 RepID=UPI0037227B32
MTPVIDVFIRSYHRDRQWLDLALRSIALFASGHRQVVVVVPRSSLERMEPSAIESTGARLSTCRDYTDDYLGQQITKLHADRYTDADMILHLDSDQVFTAPCELTARLFDHGRPRMAFDSGGTRPESDGWRRCPTTFYGEQVRADVTEPPPLIVPRHVYAGLRAHCRDAHGQSIGDYAHAAGFGRFCEFALLRGFALTREPERYTWVDTARHGRLLPECRSFWSRARTPASVADSLPPELTAAAPQPAVPPER